MTTTRLDLSRHCIETAARKKVEALIRSYFKDPKNQTEEQIKALTAFLETTDFPALRTRLGRIPTEEAPRACLVTDSKRPEKALIRYQGRTIRPPKAIP